MSTQATLRRTITNSIIKTLKKGVKPWRCPWLAAGLPVNALTEKPYRGINVILLSHQALQLDLTSNVWATYQQWQQLGCHIKARPSHLPSGQWGCPIVFYTDVEEVVVNEDGEAAPVCRSVLRTYRVFNVDQVGGSAAHRYRVARRPVAPFTTAETTINATGASIRTGGDRAFYDPAADLIQCPDRDRFSSTESYYGTLFHELCHWTGHDSRLARLEKFARFGDEAYAREELVAELGGVFLVGHVGLPLVELESHASYLDSWLRCLQRDANALFHAAAAAAKACDYVLAAAGIGDGRTARVAC